MTAAIHPNNSTKESTTFANAFAENHAALVSRRFPVITAAVFEVKMKRSACSMLLITLVGGGCTVSRATDKTPTANESREGRSSSMSNESAMRDLFDRWERVWHAAPGFAFRLWKDALSSYLLPVSVMLLQHPCKGQAATLSQPKPPQNAALRVRPRSVGLYSNFGGITLRSPPCQDKSPRTGTRMLTDSRLPNDHREPTSVAPSTNLYRKQTIPNFQGFPFELNSNPR
jgi:hypothetical protein